MRARARHRIDMLPLLDVFMVVLFVFSTIRESEVLEQAEAPAERARALAAELATLQAELERVRAEALARQERVQEEHAETVARLTREVERATATAGSASVRQRDLLAKLLDHLSVFEIDIVAAGESEDAVVNRCCYRDDPIAGAWQSCGRVPNRSDEREAWFEAGASGLVPAIRRTRGGKALVVLRQDAHAKHRVSRELETLVRARFGDHIVYDEGVALVSTTCADGGGPSR